MKTLLNHVVFAAIVIFVFATPAPVWLSDLLAVLCWMLVALGLLVTIGCMDDTVKSMASRPPHGPIHRTVFNALIVAEAVAIASTGRTFLATAWLVLLALLLFAGQEAKKVREMQAEDKAHSAQA